MESEKKTKRAVKRVCSGPVIQYRSMRMPLIEEIEVVTNKTQVIEKYLENIKQNKFTLSEIKSEDILPEHKKYYERTFITLLDDPNNVEFNKTFKVKPALKPPKRQRCVITK